MLYETSLFNVLSFSRCLAFFLSVTKMEFYYTEPAVQTLI